MRKNLCNLMLRPNVHKTNFGDFPLSSCANVDLQCGKVIGCLAGVRGLDIIGELRGGLRAPRPFSRRRILKRMFSAAATATTLELKKQIT